MTKGNILLVSILLVFFISNVNAETYNGIDFPQGSLSFADVVVSYLPTSGVGSPCNNPDQALGIPDFSGSNMGNIVSLGDEGILVVKFTNNSLTTSGNDDIDLWVFEVGGAVEPTDVAISTDGVNWIDVGSTSGATSGIDIDSYIELGVVLWEKYSYIKLRDKLPHQSDSEYPDTGADIDAIGAISSSSPITTTTCFDSDEDGVIDDWDKCPNTIKGSWINSIGCPAQGLYTEKQMNQMVSAILLWGDVNEDGKISLVEAIRALRITSGVTEPAIK